MVDDFDAVGHICTDDRGYHNDRIFVWKTRRQKAIGEISRVARWLPVVASHIFTCACCNLGCNGNLYTSRR